MTPFFKILLFVVTIMVVLALIGGAWQAVLGLFLGLVKIGVIGAICYFGFNLLTGR